MTRVLQIVPRVPPAVCGIGDYAWLLAQALREEHDIHSSFLSAGTNWIKPEGDTEFPVFRLPELTAGALVDFVAARAGEFQAIVLHMSPYGYQKRAVPLWLASGWRQIARMPGRSRLITMFHELYASGPMLSSAFWLQPLQKWMLHTVARASDGLRTNRQTYADWLERTLGLKNGVVTVMPVFSNMQEAAETEAEPAERWQGMTVFASTFDDEQSTALAEVCHRLRIQRVGWIGHREPPSLGQGLSLRHIAHLPTQEARDWFRFHGHTWTGYNPAFLAKSGIFAAFAAHRTAVVLPGARGLLADGLMEGVHYTTPGSASAADSVRLSQALHGWYLPHNVPATAASYAAQITGKLVGSPA
jgi:hypothetical protein